MILMLAVCAVVALGSYGAGAGLRTSALLGYTAVAVTVLASSELLSSFRAFSAAWLWVAWAIVLAVAAVGLRGRLIPGARRARSEFAGLRLDTWDRLFATVVAVLALGTIVQALLYPPENYDSLTAHMPRVFFWLQNHAVGHYPTPFGPQLFSGNLVAYFVAQLELVGGGFDALCALPQWTAYVGTGIVASLIAGQLGAEKRGQQVAAVVAATTPMAVLQASTTQTDLTMALWCLVVAYCLLAYVGSMGGGTPGRALGWAAWAGVALGLAVQSKASAYLVCLPLIAMAIVVAAMRGGRSRLAWHFGLAVLCALSLNAWQFARNAELLGGDLIGARAPGMAHILVADTSPGSLAVNSAKNLSLLLGTPFEPVNRAVAGSVRTAVAWFGGDIENQATKEAASGEYHLDGHITSHDVAPAPVTLALVSLALISLVFGLARPTDRLVRAYATASGSALLLVSAVVSWNLFINRITLAPLLLFAPLVGIATERCVHHRRAVWATALIGLLVSATAWALFVMDFNSTNRLVPPRLVPFLPIHHDVGYWNTSHEDLRMRVLTPELETPLEQVASAIDAAGIRRVGIHDRVAHFPVYPLLVLLRDCEVGYVGDIVLAERFRDEIIEPQAIIEVVPAEDVDAALAEDVSLGEMLAGPLAAGDVVIFAYRTPTP